MVIADNLAVYVDSVYGNAAIHNSSSLVIASVFYAFQIYFDFSGYSDIAIGTAKLFGFSLKEEFQLAVFFKITNRVLETLAHVSFVLVTGLFVHFLRR